MDEEGNLWWRYFNGTPRKMSRPVGTIKDTEYKVTRLDKHLLPGGHYESFEDAVVARRQLEIDYGVADYTVVTACTSPKSKTLDSISTFQHFNR